LLSYECSASSPQSFAAFEKSPFNALDSRPPAGTEIGKNYGMDFDRQVIQSDISGTATHFGPRTPVSELASYEKNLQF
jgi:hypothetical protein